MADHKRMKKRGRSKLFRSCFRSFYDKSDCRNSKSGRLGKPVLIAVSGREGEHSIPDDNLVNDSVDRSSNGRGVSRLLKAAVMVKKICISSKPSIAPDTNESFQSIDQSCKPSEDNTDVEDSSSRCSNLQTSSSRITSSSYSSSSSSSTNSNSRWPSDPKTSSPVHLAHSNRPISPSTRSCFDLKSSSQTDSIHLTRQNTSISLSAKSNSLPRSSSYHNQLSQSDSSNSVRSNWSISWCLFLLLSLIVLVTYGRIYSILCTSIWFYLVPSWRVKPATNTGGLADTESEQYKKRVIMAGLLDRTRNPLR